MTAHDSSSGNFWLFLEVLARRRGLILGLVIGVTLVAAIVSFVLPRWYEAKALLLPPKDMSLPMGNVGSLSEIVSVTEGLDLPVLATPTDIYARMLRSRTVAGRVIDSFDLKTRYEADTRDATFEAFLGHADSRVTEEGLLEVSVEDRDPQMAAALTNALVDQLDYLNREIVLNRARQHRQFVEQRLARVKAELDSARTELEQFQMKHRTVDFDEQTRLAIDQASELKVQLARIDIDLQVLAGRLGEENADYKELQRKRRIVQNEIEQLENSNEDNSFFSLPISEVPGLRGRYEQLYSRVKVNESLYQILLEQLEQAKISENENLPTISVLDRATPPDQRSRPRRALIVGGAFAGALIIAILLAAWLEFLRRLSRERPEDYARVAAFMSAFFGWLPGVKRQPAKS
jgi:uncharacterized protein involved in exopolysaccharide biosynthesis